jgi:hypothetical protein
MVEPLYKLYSLFAKDHHKRKERFDIILEPLQAMTNLALLAFCPPGSKLSINQNLLVIQPPHWLQGVWRSYNHDTRDDVYFLFNAIIRFSRFYAFLKTHEHPDLPKLHDKIIVLGRRGIDNMLLTYANADQPTLLHTLQMFRTMLEKPELFAQSTATDNSVKDIDDVFIKITKIYSLQEYLLLYNTLVLMERDPEQYETYINGLNALFQPRNSLIKKWINDNIVY